LNFGRIPVERKEIPLGPLKDESAGAKKKRNVEMKEGKQC